MMHFVPEQGVYVYFRYLPDEAVMVVINHNAEQTELALHRFAERTAGFTRARNGLTGQEKTLDGPWRLAPMSAVVYELMP